MNNDISFIPEELLPEELRIASQKKIEYPYLSRDTKQINKLRTGEAVSVHSAFLENRMNYKRNFWSFEDQLFEFAKKQFEKKDLELAEQCFRYLVNIGSKSAKVKEYLLRIYKKKEDRNGLNWIKNKVKFQLNESEDFHNQRSKLQKIKDKYL